MCALCEPFAFVNRFPSSSGRGPQAAATERFSDGRLARASEETFSRSIPLDCGALIPEEYLADLRGARLVRRRKRSARPPSDFGFSPWALSPQTSPRRVLRPTRSDSLAQEAREPLEVIDFDDLVHTGLRGALIGWRVLTSCFVRVCSPFFGAGCAREATRTHSATSSLELELCAVRLPTSFLPSHLLRSGPLQCSALSDSRAPLRHSPISVRTRANAVLCSRGSPKQLLVAYATREL